MDGMEKEKKEGTKEKSEGANLCDIQTRSAGHQNSRLKDIILFKTQKTNGMEKEKKAGMKEKSEGANLYDIQTRSAGHWNSRLKDIIFCVNSEDERNGKRKE